jgi:protoporphyrinogen/coproporphyrinogen III oxidase
MIPPISSTVYQNLSWRSWKPRTMSSNQQSPLHVAIIGGGIAGLAAAYTLRERAKETGLPVIFTLFEGSDRLGGKILTEQIEGFIVEGGPDSFLAQKPWAAQMAQALGLEPELMGTNPDPKKLFVVNHGKLTPMPDGVMLIIPTRFMPFITSTLISWPGKIRMGMDLIIPRRKDDSDESIGSFIRRRLGSEALDKIAEPLMSGIHVSDPEQQSVMGTFPRFRNIEKQHGSLIRGMLAQRRASRTQGSHALQPKNGTWKSSVFVSLRGGMSQLVSGLEKALSDEDIRVACPVQSVQPLPGKKYQVTTQDGNVIEVDAVVLATPAFVTANLVSGAAPDLSSALKSIRYVSTATVSVAYRKSDIGDPMKGVGFIVPRKEHRKVSACTMSSLKFSSRAPEGHLLLRCFVGGPGKEEAVDRSDEQIIADVRAELSSLLGIHSEPVFARVFRWPKGNAQYDVGHLDRVKEMHQLCPPGLFLTGSAYEGVGIPDCVHQGQQAADKVLTYLQKG